MSTRTIGMAFATAFFAVSCIVHAVEPTAAKNALVKPSTPEANNAARTAVAQRTGIAWQTID